MMQISIMLETYICSYWGKEMRNDVEYLVRIIYYSIFNMAVLQNLDT